MPVIEISKSDLESLIKRKLEDSEIEYFLPMLKCEIEEINGDIIAYEVTHDRPDLYSAEGLARALKGVLEIEKGLPIFKSKPESFETYCNGPSYRPIALFATVHGLRLDDEAIKQMMQLQEKLHATYGRNRRKISIGIYDLDTVKPPIKYTYVRPNEVSFIPLDMEKELTLDEILEHHPKGIDYAHLVKGHEYYPLLVDSRGKILSFPPIVNSEDTKVTEKTKNVFIDITTTDFKAGLNVLTIVATSLYERGEYIGLVDVNFNDGSKIYSPELSPSEMTLNISKVSKLTGITLSIEEIIGLLEKMRFSVTKKEDENLLVKIPPYRPDILHEVDLVEEVVMSYGYDKIEPLIMRPQHPGSENGLEFLTRIIRELIIGYGFQEVNNYMMTNKEVLYSRMNLQEQPTVEVKNPKQETFSCLRTWIIPQLMQVLSYSKHADYPQKIFEAGDVAIPDENSENGVREERRLALAISDRRASFTDIHAIVDSLLRHLNLNYSLCRINHDSFIEGRIAEITVDGKHIGIIGEIHPAVLEKWDLKNPVVAMEINLTILKNMLLKQSA